MKKLFDLYIDRGFLILIFLGLKISMKVRKVEVQLVVEDDEIYELDLNKDSNKLKLKEDSRKKLIVVRFDAIGDYILFRPFLKSIREYYKDYHITYIGNILHRDIFMHFDSIYVDNYTFINIYNISMLEGLEWDLLISPVYSRTSYTDEFVKLIEAKDKIGCYGNLTNITDGIRAQGNIEYTKFVHHNKNIDFEFYINKYFFEVLFNKHLDINSTKFDLNEEYFNSIDFNFNSNYIVIFPSASDKRRQWCACNFKKLSQYIHKKYGCNVYIPGSSNDGDIVGEIIGNNRSFIHSICGKYKLHELPYIFSKAKFIITNDTMAYHMAVATNDKVICISNGNTYTRFVNYPKDLIKDKTVIQIFPKDFADNMENKSFENDDYEQYSMYDINSIGVEELISKLDSSFIL